MITKKYHNYKKWEDYNFGMYETICFMDKNKLINECIYTLKCKEQLFECMMFVVYNWGYSTEQQLTNFDRNRQAWLGQAACCFLHGAPEYITKFAWNLLSEKEQNEANKIANDVICFFEENYERNYFEWQK